MSARTFHISVAIALAGTLFCASSFAALPVDIGVYRPSDGNLYLDFDRDGNADRTIVFPSPHPDVVLVGDLDGDGLQDIVTFKAGVWTIDYDGDGIADAVVNFGAPGDIPLVGDVDGDGRADLVVYRGGTWYASTHRDGFADRMWNFGGAPSDIPLLGDINCSGVASPLIYRDGVWFALPAPDMPSIVLAHWGGIAGDRPFAVDWDGDCYADIGVFRNGEWYVRRGLFGTQRTSALGFGAAGDIPLAGRIHRNFGAMKYRRAMTHYALFNPVDGTFSMRLTREDYPDLILRPGIAGIPVAADFDRNGRTDLAVYANGRWYVDLDLDGTADATYDFGGVAGDIPLAGDVNGDGNVDLVIYRNGTWFVSTARDGVASIMHNFGGAPGDQPVLGDVNGDGTADFGIYRAGIWFFDTNRDGVADVIFGFGGMPQDKAFVADWNGDGRADLGVYRDGAWFVTTAPATGQVALQLGFGDVSGVPVAGNFVVDTTVEPVVFAPAARPLYSGAGQELTAAVVDLDFDGWPETIGSHNSGAAKLLGVPVSRLGLGSIYSANRQNRDCRVADLNGDALPDIVCNTYSPSSDTASFARLFFGVADGTYAEDAAFAAMSIRGFGETIVAADFDNDGAVDLFLPFYSHTAPTDHSYLLHNGGSGHFTDIADSAGVALRNVPLDHRVEGAQAVDYDGDGWIDLYVGGRLFHNNGNLTFTDVTDAVGLPGSFDEGFKFIDWNNDGKLDLIIHHPVTGPTLWEFDGARYRFRDVMPAYGLLNAYGINIADLNGDGREDLIMSGGLYGTPAILLNSASGFQRDPQSLVDDIPFGLSSIADFDGDGRLDLLLTDGYGVRVVARNVSPAIPRSTLTIEVVDAAGRRNQYGRVARISPLGAPGITMTRIVDGGSGLMAQTPYAMTVPTPYAGSHSVTVRFATGNVTFTMPPGQRIRVYADGRTQAY